MLLLNTPPWGKESGRKEKKMKKAVKISESGLEQYISSMRKKENVWYFEKSRLKQIEALLSKRWQEGKKTGWKRKVGNQDIWTAQQDLEIKNWHWK